MTETKGKILKIRFNLLFFLVSNRNLGKYVLFWYVSTNLKTKNNLKILWKQYSQQIKNMRDKDKFKVELSIFRGRFLLCFSFVACVFLDEAYREFLLLFNKLWCIKLEHSNAEEEKENDKKKKRNRISSVQNKVGIRIIFN